MLLIAAHARQRAPNYYFTTTQSQQTP